MALLDDINLFLRDHAGYTGDGQGGNGPLPVGDRSTRRHMPDLRDWRALLKAIAQSMGDPAALQTIIDRQVRKGGTLANGTDLNTVREPGTYFLNANGGYSNGPSLLAGESYHLIVHAQGGGDGSGDTRFFRQSVASLRRVALGGLTDHWERSLDRDNPSNVNHQWRRPSRDQDELVVQRGELAAGTDIGTLRSPGEYFLPPSITNLGLPTDADLTQAYRVIVSNPGAGTGTGKYRFGNLTVESLTVSEAGTSRAHRKSWTRRHDGNAPTNAVGSNAWTPVVGGVASGGGASRLAGKRIVVFGDSIAEGNASFKWPPTLASLTGATVVNGGFGGCRMAVYDEPSVGHLYDPMSMYRLSERIKNGDWSVLTAAAQALYTAEGDDNRLQAAALAAVNWAQVDYIVIAYGTNDFRGTSGMGVPIGSDADTTGATFKGAINLTIQNILTAYPHIQIMFVTPLWRSRVAVSGEDSNVTPNGSGVFLRQYVQAIKDRAAPYQIPIADLHAESGINILNWATYMPDGLHPYTQRGMDRVSGFIAARMEAVF